MPASRFVGFHPLGSDGDTPEFLAGLLRTGRAESNAAADHVTVVAQAIAAVPPSRADLVHAR